jgi:hypothetical protein
VARPGVGPPPNPKAYKCVLLWRLKAVPARFTAAIEEILSVRRSGHPSKDDLPTSGDLASGRGADPLGRGCPPSRLQAAWGRGPAPTPGWPST